MLFIYLFIFWAGGEIWLMLTKTLLVFVLVEKFQFMFWMFIDFFFISLFWRLFLIAELLQLFLLIANSDILNEMGC